MAQVLVAAAAVDDDNDCTVEGLLVQQVGQVVEHTSVVDVAAMAVVVAVEVVSVAHEREMAAFAVDHFRPISHHN